MRFVLVLSALALLGACADQPGDCATGASRDIRALDRLIAETRANIDRGYAYASGPATGGDFRFCLGGASDNVGLAFCNPGSGGARHPVAIDAAAEKRKLAELIDKRNERARALAACPPAAS